MFARELIAQLDEVREFSPQSEFEDVEEGEDVVGALSEDLRRLYVVGHNLRKKAIKVAKEIMHLMAEIVPRKPGPEEQEKIQQLQRQHNVLVCQIEAAAQLFWASVKTEFPEAVDKSIGLRKGWQVVSYENDSSEVESLVESLVSAMPRFMVLGR